MYFRKMGAACMAGAMACTAPVALAQDQAVADVDPPSVQSDAPAPWQPLAAEGVTLSLSYTGEAATNVSGGLRRDATHAGQVYVGAELDLDRMIGIDGATLHFAVTNRHGKNLSAMAIGNNTSVQEIYGTQNTHLAILTWQQSFLDGLMYLEAGRRQSNIHFLNSQIY